jgi:hypothetical protein
MAGAIIFLQVQAITVGTAQIPDVLGAGGVASVCCPGQSIAAGQKAILMGVHHIELDACHIKDLTGVGLIVADIGIMTLDALKRRTEVLGSGGGAVGSTYQRALFVNVIDNVLQIELFMVDVNEPGEAL